MKNKRKIVIFFLFFLSLIFVAGGVYLNDYYRADIEAIQAFLPQDYNSYETIENTTVFPSENATKGFIFYPGGKVEHTAYFPLLHTIAKEEILCILLEMPFHLAVLDMNAAEGIQEQFPEIEQWYIGGHSLGGAMAASYLENNISDYEGLILLGSYSTADLSNTELEILSIYGSEDNILNQEKYLANKTNLPSGFTEIILQGGCHAYFGMYGNQEGDGTPKITNDAQIEQTAKAITDMIKQ